MPSSSRKDYLLATGEEAVNRLFLLNEIFGAGSQEVLQKAGLRPGMHVAEIGCGTGLVATWMADIVGAGGSVTGVDLSAEQLRVAEQNASRSGRTNVSFRTSGAYETNLPRESFDLVYSRFLLCHVAEPLRAIVEMRSLLKPGGILVCEDHDDGGIFTEPPSHAYERLVEISKAVNQSRGLDSYIGLKLPGLVLRAGFATPEVSVHQHARLRGRAKKFWEITLQEAAPAIYAAGVSTPDELESICAEMGAIANDETILLMLARVTQVWAQK